MVVVKLKSSPPKWRHVRLDLLQLRAASGRATSSRYSSAAEAQAKGAYTMFREGPPPMIFYGTVKIGMPQQEFTVAFDTGSGNIVVPSYVCQSLSCISHRSYSEGMSATGRPIVDITNFSNGKIPPNGNREKAEMHIGEGKVSGDLVYDIVCLSQPGACAKTGVIIATEMSHEPFSLFPYDGILGLGLPESSLEPRFNLLGNLAEKKVLQNNIFAIWLANEDEGNDSEITFGSWKKDRIGSGMLWLPVEYETGVWQVPLLDVAIMNQKRDQCQGGCKALLDTGTNAIGMPNGMSDAILLELSIEKDCSNYHNLPVLGFVFEGFLFNLDPWDYVKRAGGSCYPQVFGIDIPPPKGPMVLLGTPFLRRYYTVFSRTSLKIGLSLAVHKTEHENEDIETVQKRLIVPMG